MWFPPTIFGVAGFGSPAVTDESVVVTEGALVRAKDRYNKHWGHSGTSLGHWPAARLGLNAVRATLEKAGRAEPAGRTG